LKVVSAGRRAGKKIEKKPGDRATLAAAITERTGGRLTSGSSASKGKAGAGKKLRWLGKEIGVSKIHRHSLLINVVFHRPSLCASGGKGDEKAGGQHSRSSYERQPILWTCMGQEKLF